MTDFEKTHHISEKDASALLQLLQQIACRNNFVFQKPILKTDFFGTKDRKTIVFFPSYGFFKSKISSKMDNVWIYKKASRVKEILESDEIALSSLTKNMDNDYGEYSESLLHLGMMEFFIPDSKGHPPIAEMKKNIFILCTTNEYNNSKHWDEYADHSTGAAINISFDFSKLENMFSINANAYAACNYGRVYYDNGYDFDFFKETAERVQSEIGKKLIFSGSKQMALMYKRKKYAWEKESRIAIDLNENATPFIDDFCSSKDFLLNKNKKFFKLNKAKGILFIKNQNPLFSWKIKSVSAGPEISEKDFEILKKLCAERDINFIP